MRARALRLAAGVLLTATGLVGTVAGGLAFGQSSDEVTVLRLEGVVDPLVADYITSGLARARERGGAAVLIQIDTPGGLDSSMREITQAILNAEVPVICYVSPGGARAASAGAFILLSCPVAAMAPGTNVGASTPIGLAGGDLADKVANDAAAYIRSIAETYGRNAEVAESFVTEAASISAEEAARAGVIDLVAPSTSTLLSEIDGRQVTLGTGSTVTLATTGLALREEPMGSFVGFLHELFDPNIAFIFFWLGLALIVLELLIPGHVFSGTVGTILFVISILAFGLLPVRSIGILLLIVSVVAFVIELKAPGLGIWGGAGVVTLLLGGWFLYDRSGGVQVSPGVILPVAAFIGLFFGVVVAKVLKMRELPPAQGPGAVVGLEGVAVGSGVTSRGGIVRVAAEEWQAVSPSGDVGPGERVRVTQLDGLTLTVEPIGSAHVPG